MLSARVPVPPGCARPEPCIYKDLVGGGVTPEFRPREWEKRCPFGEAALYRLL